MMNPLQFMKAMRNPQEFMKQAMNNSDIMSNPIAKNALEMYQKGDMKGLQAMAENLAKERGTTVNDMKSQIMAQFGMK
mgnify:FL=1